jgi:CHAD domain-containing protein
VLETEFKFAVGDTFALPAFDAGKAGVVDVRELSPQELKASYYDSEDLRLARSGITLRYRTGEEAGGVWSLKLPVDKDGTSRDELHFEGDPPTVPDAALDLVFAYRRGSKLDRVAKLVTRRRRWSLRGEDEDELAELVQDDVSVLDGERILGRFTELELEKRRIDVRGLEHIAQVLREAGALSAEPIPKAVRAIGPEATAPPDIPSPPTIGPDAPADTAIKGAFTSALRRLLRNDPYARLGDAEGVHQVRVAARRLRSDLRTFSPLLDPSWARNIGGELRWLADALGEVRDLDVLHARLRSFSEGLEDDLAPLFDELKARHDAAKQHMLEEMRSERYRRLIETLVEAANHPALTADASAKSVKALPPLVSKAWKKLAKKARQLDPDDDEEAFHKVRIRAKRVRYASETAAASLEGDSAKKAFAFAKHAEKIQDVLGETQDAAVAQRVIMEIAPAHRDLNFAVAAGRLIERQYVDSESIRARFFEVWRAFDRKKNRSWLTE